MNIPPGVDPSKSPAAIPPPGVNPNFVDPPSLKAAALAISIALMAIATILVAVRLFVRVKDKKLGIDDGLSCQRR